VEYTAVHIYSQTPQTDTPQAGGRRAQPQGHNSHHTQLPARLTRSFEYMFNSNDESTNGLFRSALKDPDSRRERGMLAQLD